MFPPLSPSPSLQSTQVQLWLDAFTIRSDNAYGPYLLMLAGVFALCVAHEALTLFRVRRAHAPLTASSGGGGAAGGPKPPQRGGTGAEEGRGGPEGAREALLPSPPHFRDGPPASAAALAAAESRRRLTQTGLYVANAACSYLIMLATMT